MIIYSGTKADFMEEVEADTIAYSIRGNILKKIRDRKTSDPEFRSRANSFNHMHKVLSDDDNSN